MTSYAPFTSRVQLQASNRDEKTCRLNGTAQYSVKEKGCLTLSPQNLREARRNWAGMQSPLSPTMVRISSVVTAEPTFGSQFEAVKAGEAAASRPSTPPPRHTGGSSVAPPTELANRPPSTPKRSKKAYDGLGHGIPPSRSKAMAASTMFIMKPGPDRSCSPVRRPSGRSASRSSSYCGIPIDSLEKGPVDLIDYPHYELNKLTIATRESSLLHLVPQVVPCPSSLGQSERRPMIFFTNDLSGITLDHSEGVLREILEIFPGDPRKPNPHCIHLELYYPGLPFMTRKYDFMSRENHRANLFATVRMMVKDLVKDLPQPVAMPRGLDSWEPVNLYQRKWFRLLGLKHICDNRYLIALGVSSSHIPLL